MRLENKIGKQYTDLSHIVKGSFNKKRFQICAALPDTKEAFRYYKGARCSKGMQRYLLFGMGAYALRVLLLFNSKLLE